MKSLVLLAAWVPAMGQVAITLQHADQAALPGATRSLYADVEGTANLTVKWKATGGCTLASPTTTAEPQVVTMPARGGACSLRPGGGPSFQSPVSCTVIASSAADESKTAGQVIPVCGETVSVSTFPAGLVLYKNQPGVIQSNLRGSTNTGVTWTIATNPGNAGALLGGASNRHTVFSAKAAGTYVLTATSVADPAKKFSSTIWVTGNEMPAANADHTEPVDCTAVGKGRVLDVGPAWPLKDLNAVTWGSLKGGDTVRIHNDDKTGSAPTTYHQHFAIPGGGTAQEPLRVCGVPDAKGVKPIVDGANASTREDEDWASGYIEGLGVVALYDAGHKWGAALAQNRNVMIEGLHIRNGSNEYKYMKQKTRAATTYEGGAACVLVQTGIDVLIRGNELENCSQGVFSNGRTPGGSMVYDLTVEGNYLHNWGSQGSYLVHAMYLQGIGLTVQFNYFGASVAGALGNAIKSRSVLNFLRWNYISQPVTTTARAFDMVEPQAFVCYVVPARYAYNYRGEHQSDCYPPAAGVGSDPITADQIAANYEAYHSDYIYGNIMDDTGTDVPFVHYGYDQQSEQGPEFDRRGGTLYYWANTHLSRKPSGTKTVFDPAAPDQDHSYEFPVVQSVNNVFLGTGAIGFQWTRTFWSQVVVNSNAVYPKYELPDHNGRDTYQGGTSPAEAATCNQYGTCRPGKGHVTWERDGKPGTAAASLYYPAGAFSVETFLPSAKLRGLAAKLPREIQDQPSNMEYFPAANRIAFRAEMTALGAVE